MTTQITKDYTTAEALVELRTRTERAVSNLDKLIAERAGDTTGRGSSSPAEAHRRSREAARLNGKREGVKLVLDYIEDAIRDALPE
jgi:hypothetical protein